MPKSVYNDLKMLGADVDRIKQFSPTEKQLVELRNGIVKLMKEHQRQSRL